MVDTSPDKARLDLARLGEWFMRTVPEAAWPVSAERIAGGRSNLTYEIDDGSRTYILRRPPLGHVLATAHDMGREYRVMQALRDTAVPVPRMYALCEDPTVLGAPFYVMERVAGEPYRDAVSLSVLGPGAVRRISRDVVTLLSGLHAVHPAEVGLQSFGRPEGFLARQVARWAKQLDASRSRELPGVERLIAQLSSRVPPMSPAAIVHGDYRIDNVLFVLNRPTAIIDWEMSTLGDPLTDVALLMVYDRVAQLPEGRKVFDVCSADGYISASETVELYATGSGRDVGDIEFYVALAFLKLAAIFEGIHYRHLHGETVGDGFEAVGAATQSLVDAGLDALSVG